MVGSVDAQVGDAGRAGQLDHHVVRAVLDEDVAVAQVLELGSAVVRHDSGVDRFLLDLREGERPEARTALMDAKLERFIGVIYRPDTERWSHYSSAILPKQLDAWVWFDETSAVTPLPTRQREGAEETYPFGL